MKKIFTLMALAALGTALVFHSCKKDDKNNNSNSNNNNTTQATCSDGIQNQGETDVDCGGPCASCDEKYLCTGKGSNSYFPLKEGNYWIWTSSMYGIIKHLITEKVMDGVTPYYHCEEYVQNIQMSDWYYRVDPNGDVYYSTNPNTSGSYSLKVPGSPYINQKWKSGTDSMRVTSLNASYNTTKCNYTGLLEISVKYAGDVANNYYEIIYYKKGIGSIYNGDANLTGVNLN
ncbi:MAG: hypothetical protein WC223_07860 [Bacteroidales bacterium]|jgi:hypothetical protein